MRFMTFQEGFPTNEGHGCTPEDGTGKGVMKKVMDPKPTKPLTAEERKELQDEIKQAVLQVQSAGYVPILRG